ncbi:hypothetical protein ACFYNN_13015 [Streptomyces sp. NPDC006978]|uniref:hypothetical protein n=1 Tax=Streptomyces sp. NPDC006978 TaxID=3364769 RepID=UPI003677AF23
MTETTTTISTSSGPFTVPAEVPAPGLLSFEIPAEVSPTSQYRWILSHHEGTALAAFQTHAEVTAAAHAVAVLADWTRNAMTAANEISFGGNTELLMELLKANGGQHPNA